MYFNFDVELVKEKIPTVRSLRGLLKALGFYQNGTTTKKLKKFLERNQISTEIWKTKRSKYESVVKICPHCKKEFTAVPDSKTPKGKVTCSYKCSNSFIKRMNNETKSKISKGLKKYIFALSIAKPRSKQWFLKNKNQKMKMKKLVFLYSKICNECQKEYKTKNKDQKFCKKECVSSFASKDVENKLRAKERIKRRREQGLPAGWMSRTIVSYPEKFWMTVLTNNNILFAHNKREDKYFIDFAIEEGKIALEIDGKQHLIPERAAQDKIKDEVLINAGWKVYRIPWNGINTEQGQELMKGKIEKFIEFYKSVKK